MSKADGIQKKLWKAYGKVGKTLGYDFELYRPDKFDDPINDRYYIDTKKVAFSQDTEYRKVREEGLSIWHCWLDGRLQDLFDIQFGDYLLNPQTNEIYFIASAEKHLFIKAMKTNDFITISRVQYADSAYGFSSSDSDIVTNLPALMYQPRSERDSGYVPADTSLFSSQPSYDYYVADPFNSIRIGDAVTDQNGNRSQVSAVYITDIGTHLKTMAYDSE